MSLKKALLTSSLVCLMGTSASAIEMGGFAGINLGYGKTHAAHDMGNYQLSDTSGFVYGINGGYNLDNHFGVEAQANRDSTAKYTSIIDTSSHEWLKFYDIDLLADGYVPLENNVDLVGKAGIAYVRATSNAQIHNNDHDNFYRPKLALGVAYTTTENVILSATYSRIFKQGELSSTKYLPNLDMAALTVDYLF